MRELIPGDAADQAAAAAPPPIQLDLTIGPSQPQLTFEARFDDVCDRLGLDALERAVLAVCVAPEVHPDFGMLFGRMYGSGPRSATPRIAGKVLSGAGLSEADVLVCFDRRGRLVASGAVRLHVDGPLADHSAVAGGQLVNRLLGSRLADDGRDGRLTRAEVSPLPIGRAAELERLAAMATSDSQLPLAVIGPDALAAVAAVTDRGVIALAATALLDADARADLSLAATLEGRVPVIQHLGEIKPEDVRQSMLRATEMSCRPVLCATGPGDALALADLTVHLVELPAPDPAERLAAWQAATGVADPATVAARFRLDIGQIAEAAQLAVAEAGGGDLTPADLWRGARAASSGRLAELAQRLPPGPMWDDLILPSRQMSALQAMSSFLEHRDRVLSEWGYRRIVGQRGLTVLFAGESGTGKTLAAQVVAGVAGLDVFRVDLSNLFSKWVGETEKNLERMFVAAESANAVLFFDEADVVFGKRTDAGDSSDRYANLETAFLLQRIERYDGIVVLATNLRSNMDDAFVRRLDLVVDFPPPDEATRQRLWELLLPVPAPRADDIDYKFLAHRFELSGGGIRNCSLAAALLAAGAGEEIHMHHLVRGVAMEYAKLGRLTVEADFGDYLPLINPVVEAPGR